MLSSRSGIVIHLLRLGYHSGAVLARISPALNAKITNLKNASGTASMKTDPRHQNDALLLASSAKCPRIYQAYQAAYAMPDPPKITLKSSLLTFHLSVLVEGEGEESASNASA